MAGDHPDPSILKDGADYYMTFSTFDSYPGLVIWHSRDLVNWRPIGPALHKNIGAVWAPELCKHDGRYFLYIPRSDEHTSELQSLMRISYAVFCLKKQRENRRPTVRTEGTTERHLLLISLGQNKKQ